MTNNTDTVNEEKSTESSREHESMIARSMIKILTDVGIEKQQPHLAVQRTKLYRQVSLNNVKMVPCGDFCNMTGCLTFGQV